MRRIVGNQDGPGGRNETYTIGSRKRVPRAQAVKEVEQGKHPGHHVVEIRGRKYVRDNPDGSKLDNVNPSSELSERRRLAADERLAEERRNQREREKESLVRSSLAPSQSKNLYEVKHFLDKETRERTSLTIRCLILPQDSAVAAAHEELGVQEVHVRWEPGIDDGPTSSRVAVVDYNGDTGTLTPPAVWNSQEHRFLTPDNKPITSSDTDTPHFRQVNVWAIVERVIEYFEHPQRLGRPVPWGFDGNRLIVVPHAGFGENAYYSRRSKSLQFYYFGDPDKPMFTCLSHDIVAHETGHAVLDGIRPYYSASSSVQTAAFHEFMGDLVAILGAMRNNHLRRAIAKTVSSDLAKDKIIANLAEEFGSEVNDSREGPYLRTAHNNLTMNDVANSASPHRVSQVLTGAMFDILVRMANAYREQDGGNKPSAAQALNWAINRFGRVAIQPLDLCPPVDIQFVDYARAVLENLALVDETDGRGFRASSLEVFHERGLCPHGTEEHHAGDCALLRSDARSLRPSIYHDVDRLAGSRTDAYHYLHDNRDAFRIPKAQDFVVADLYKTYKQGRAARRLPVEIVLEYIWKEPVTLAGARFGRWEGATVELLCGGTLVLDGRGNVRSWFRKPGTEHVKDELAGIERRTALLDHIERQVRTGRMAAASEVEGIGLQTPPILTRRVDGVLSLESAPHFRGKDEEGDEPWTVSF